MTRGSLFGGVVIIAAVLAACSSDRAGRAPDARHFPKDTRATSQVPSALVGQWVYQEEGVVFPLVVDESGNGTYAWKDGYWVTTSFSQGLWQGTWHQRENEREGGFEIRLSGDCSEGEGHWWYTRIGTNTAPDETGGTFNLMRAEPLPPGCHL
ncbi:MAG: hypothetical protein ACE5NA_03145 [Nitrospiraceae bacterium]